MILKEEIYIKCITVHFFVRLFFYFPNLRSFLPSLRFFGVKFYAFNRLKPSLILRRFQTFKRLLNCQKRSIFVNTQNIQAVNLSKIGGLKEICLKIKDLLTFQPSYQHFQKLPDRLFNTFNNVFNIVVKNRFYKEYIIKKIRCKTDMKKLNAERSHPKNKAFEKLS